MTSFPTNQPPRDMPDIAKIIAALCQHHVEFVVCGGAACVLHGMEGRITADVDIAVRLEPENLNRFVSAAQELQFLSRIPEPLGAIADPVRRKAWIEQKGAVVSTYSSPAMLMQLDVFLAYPIPFDELAKNADRMRQGEHQFLVSSKQHLILAKQHVKPQRRIDRSDIENLQELIERERTA